MIQADGESPHGAAVELPAHDRTVSASIDRHGAGYRYDGSHHERLSDAVAQARSATRAHGGPPHAAVAFSLRRDDPQLHADAARQRLARLAIDLDASRYGSDGYRYDRLDDAVRCGELTVRRRGKAAL